MDMDASTHPIGTSMVTGGSHVLRPALMEFLDRLDARFHRPGCVYLIGETTQLFEGWRPWTTHLALTTEVADEHGAVLTRMIAELAREGAVRVDDESPADVIPLPDGYAARARSTPLTQEWEAGAPGRMSLRHFDPYSVAILSIARGDEPDYHMTLMFMDRGWITEGELTARLAGLLPRLTAETIQQDPAELRRKYKGLVQMWRAVRPHTTHRPTAV
jgi:hypothetical protein